MTGRLSFLRIPVGPTWSRDCVALFWNPEGLLTHIHWASNLRILEKLGTPASSEAASPRQILEIADRLRAYFSEGLPIGEPPWEAIDHSGWTDFQRQVYRAIAKIPHAETRTYGWVAMQVGRTSAARAVGQALRNNPVPILVPCHRVVSVKSIGGFMGATEEDGPELMLKKKLLGLEEDYRSPVFSFLTATLAHVYSS
jgi:methylated-DNA-[protein]-cysteine S-methyltransferase